MSKKLTRSVTFRIDEETYLFLERYKNKGEIIRKALTKFMRQIAEIDRLMK